MDCDRAGEAMMRYMDKKIKPSSASKLAHHVLVCESCREYFLAFDMAAEAEIVEAPDGFTSSVMSKIYRIPAYARTGIKKADIFLRVLWGLCAVLLGVTFWIMYNSDSVTAFVASNPGLSAISQTYNSFVNYINNFFAQSLFVNGSIGTETIVSSGGHYIALLFVFLLSVVLLILKRDEKVRA